MEKRITAGTITRTALLAIALANQVITAMGHSPLPIDNELLTQGITLGFTIITSIAAWWSNNSFTKNAIEADELLHSKRKKENKYE